MEACVDVERGLLFCDESAMFLLPRPNLSEHDLGCMVLSPSHFTIWTNKKVRIIFLFTSVLISENEFCDDTPINLTLNFPISPPHPQLVQSHVMIYFQFILVYFATFINP